MKKSNETVVHFNKYFGSSKDYYLFLIRSKYDFYRFGALISKLSGSPVSYIGNVHTENIDGNPVFRILYTLASKQTQAEIFIIENKTTEHQLITPQEKMLTLFPSLFDQVLYYYIANKSTPTIVRTKNVDYDFLVLVSKDIECSATETLSIFNNALHFESEEITPFITPAHPANKNNKITEFFQSLFYTSNIKVVEFTESQNRKILGTRGEIPEANKSGRNRIVPPEIKQSYIDLLLYDKSFE